jgi:hypothetical protein
MSDSRQTACVTRPPRTAANENLAGSPDVESLESIPVE